MNYYDELPEGYKVKKVIDAGNKKTAWILNLVGIPILLLCFFLLYLWKPFEISQGNTKQLLWMELGIVGFLISLVAYLVLHELIHGLWYKIFTKKKLTFGLKWSCAYCGVPTIYMKKGPMIVTILAPFITFTVFFLIIYAFIPTGYYAFLMNLLISSHVAGCIGDLYGFLIMLGLPKDSIINDTGPKQTFYIKDEPKDTL